MPSVCGRVLRPPNFPQRLQIVCKVKINDLGTANDFPQLVFHTVSPITRSIQVLKVRYNTSLPHLGFHREESRYAIRLLIALSVLLEKVEISEIMTGRTPLLEDDHRIFLYPLIQMPSGS